ncbi:hypothetical protein GQ54DRAFT_298871 [Martensiomyces pterosporus]|nr:hypothetical protein GQ54DRAFT_298871 [Martensiomyces pterosporus]
MSSCLACGKTFYDCSICGVTICDCNSCMFGLPKSSHGEIRECQSRLREAFRLSGADPAARQFRVPKSCHALASELMTRLARNYSPAADHQQKRMRLACFAHWPRYCELCVPHDNCTFFHADSDLQQRVAQVEASGRQWCKVHNNLEAAVAVSVLPASMVIIDPPEDGATELAEVPMEPVMELQAENGQSIAG